jgi:hypothetical protein
MNPFGGQDIPITEAGLGLTSGIGNVFGQTGINPLVGPQPFGPQVFNGITNPIGLTSPIGTLGSTQLHGLQSLGGITSPVSLLNPQRSVGIGFSRASACSQRSASRPLASRPSASSRRLASRPSASSRRLAR